MKLYIHLPPLLPTSRGGADWEISCQTFCHIDLCSRSCSEQLKKVSEVGAGSTHEIKYKTNLHPFRGQRRSRVITLMMVRWSKAVTRSSR